MQAAHHAHDVYVYVYVTCLIMLLANRLDGIKRKKLRLLFQVGQLCEVHDKEKDDWILACVRINCTPPYTIKTENHILLLNYLFHCRKVNKVHGQGIYSVSSVDKTYMCVV